MVQRADSFGWKFEKLARERAPVRKAVMSRALARSIAMPEQLSSFSDQDRKEYILQCFRAVLTALNSENSSRHATAPVSGIRSRASLKVGKFEFWHELDFGGSAKKMVQSNNSLGFSYSSPSSNLSFVIGGVLARPVAVRFSGDFLEDLGYVIDKAKASKTLTTKPLWPSGSDEIERIKKSFLFYGIHL